VRRLDSDGCRAAQALRWQPRINWARSCFPPGAVRCDTCPMDYRGGRATSPDGLAAFFLDTLLPFG